MGNSKTSSIWKLPSTAPPNPSTRKDPFDFLVHKLHLDEMHCPHCGNAKISSFPNNSPLASPRKPSQDDAGRVS
jgi:hypothetical protein